MNTLKWSDLKDQLPLDENDMGYIISIDTANQLLIQDIPRDTDFVFLLKDKWNSFVPYYNEPEYEPQGRIEFDFLGEICIRMSLHWTQQSWKHPIGLEYHMDLMNRLLEFRKNQFGDISLIQYVNQEDGTFLLNFYIVPKSDECDSLGDVYKYGYGVINWIDDHISRSQEEVSRKLNSIGTGFSTLSLVEIPELLARVQSEQNVYQKGILLEELICKLLSQIDGFDVYERVRTQTEEIDLVIKNRNHDVWNKESTIILVECKNWSTNCGKNEVVLFKEKIENRWGRCSLGFFVSWNGFASTFKTENLRSSKDSILIVPITGDQIINAIHENNFKEKLEVWWLKAINE